MNATMELDRHLIEASMSCERDEKRKCVTHYTLPVSIHYWITRTFVEVYILPDRVMCDVIEEIGRAGVDDLIANPVCQVRKSQDIRVEVLNPDHWDVVDARVQAAYRKVIDQSWEVADREDESSEEISANDVDPDFEDQNPYYVKYGHLAELS